MKIKNKRKRLYGKKKVRMPKPGFADPKAGFSLRLIEEADSRFAVVKQMKKRLEHLLADCDIQTQAEEWMAARAVFVLSYLESVEVNAYEGKEISWSSYMQACNALNSLLTKLGALGSERKPETVSLED